MADGLMGVRILGGDCREVLPSLEARSVQCCVSSPPYWGLRDYGTAQWEGGEVGCDHMEIYYEGLNGKETPGGRGGSMPHRERQYKSGCAKCGARRIDAQLGLEATPQEYIASMVAVFRAVWRVLRNDGTLWVNMGDSYAYDTKGNGGTNSSGLSVAKNGVLPDDRKSQPTMHPIRCNHGLKPKDLCMMPARLAMALQADGWYLRSEIVWHKPNPMPESVSDRPTKAHEMIYLLAKRERYFYDAEAIREKTDPDSFRGRTVGPKVANGDGKSVRNCSPSFLTADQVDYRNKRSVWTIATQPYAQAHFATFPEEIPKLCILAGSRLGDTVLDPFAGSGTVGQVALELGRRAILIELSPDYIELAKARTFVTPGFL